MQLTIDGQTTMHKVSFRRIFISGIAYRRISEYVSNDNFIANMNSAQFVIL